MKLPVILLFFSLLVFGCSPNDTLKQKKPSKRIDIKDSSTVRKTKPIMLDSAISLHLIKRLAESYNPPNTNSNGYGKLPELNDSIKTAFEVLKRKNYKEFKKYLSLIFIKLYRSHMRTSHQGYEIRHRDGEGDSLRKDREFLAYEFNLMAKLYPLGKRVEMFSSSVAQVWLESNPELLKDRDIKREMKAIQSVGDSIQNGLYWK